MAPSTRSIQVGSQIVGPQLYLCRSSVSLLLLLVIFGHTSEAKGAVCNGNSAALAALHSKENFTAQSIKDIGYGFYFFNPELIAIEGGPYPGGPQYVTRGLVILPTNGLDAAAYAPYSRQVALAGYYVVILNKATPGRVLEAMMQYPEFLYWGLAGHGTGGELAARIAVALQPRVKSLVLIAAALPPDVDLRTMYINLFVTVIYGDQDTITTPADVRNSFSRLLGDALIMEFPGFGHYDFAYSLCLRNTKAPSNASGVLNSTYSASIALALVTSIALTQWASGTKGAISFGENHYLTPGFNDSKPYPGDIRVRADEVPIPGTSPQRLWWVFTPTQINGGIVYYPGAAVDGRAYFPLAFEIAARGHLVVVVQQPARDALNTFQDANTVIDSNLPIFSGVPKGRWAISGHSLGGIGAINYLACFGNKIYGAVLHSGGWSVDTNTSQVPVLQIYGSIDDLGGGNNSYVRNNVGLFNPNKTTFVVVQGADHYQVGDYGYQVPDQIATISLETQHGIYAGKTVKFLDGLETKAYAPVLFGPLCGS